MLLKYRKFWSIIIVLGCIFADNMAQAAGPLGHFLIGQKLVENISSGRVDVDPELKQILQYPDAVKAFNGGCVGPDLAESATHYKQTADIAASMLTDARRNYHNAKTPAEIDQARKQLAFAFGWYSHCATDLNVHPKVNGTTGDTFRYNTAEQKSIHALQEAQMTAYLRSTVGKIPYEVSIPFDFLSKHIGVSEDDLRKENTILRTKVLGELADSSLLVNLNDKMRDSWREVCNQSLRYSELLLKTPNAMQNWDLDCGKISTQDFEDLRKLAIEANGGKLPESWGKNYLTWFEKLKGMPNAQRLEILKALIKPPQAVSSTAVYSQKQRTKTTSSPRPAPIPAMAWVRVGTKEFQISDANYTNSGAAGNYTLTWDSHGCSTPGCPGEVLSVRYECSEAPAIIIPDKKLTFTLSGYILKNTIKHYSANTSMDVFFDRVDIDPGSYGGGPGVGGIKIGGKDNSNPAPLTVQASPGSSYQGIGKMALIIAMYNGRSCGTKYVYEWKSTK